MYHLSMWVYIGIGAAASAAVCGLIWFLVHRYRSREGFITMIWADGINEQDVENLREQVDLAMRDPDYQIIANYQIQWEQVRFRGRALADRRNVHVTTHPPRPNPAWMADSTAVSDNDQQTDTPWNRVIPTEASTLGPDPIPLAEVDRGPRITRFDILLNSQSPPKALKKQRKKRHV
jgi:hypothetical protein